jgi:serine/threonine protein kinase
VIEGQLVGSYRLLDRIGRGGTAVVWKARDERSGALVALKELSPLLARDVSFRARAIREAETLLPIHHPNIVRLLDCAGDASYLVYELVPGGSVEERLLREGKLPWREAVQIGVDVARALGAAHERGIVHRDLKPGNVLLGPDGRARLADFGLARPLDARTLTETGEFLGTIGYAAPEQLEGAKEAGPSADLYALGALLHALVSGEPPFGQGPPLTIVKRQVTERPRPLRALVVETPVALEQLVQRLLERRPEARYASAPLVLAELEAIARAAPRTSKARLLGGFAALFVLGVGLASLLGGGGAKPPPVPSPPPSPPASTAPIAPQRAEENASEILSLTLLADAVATGSEDGTIRTWSLEDGRALQRLPLAKGPVDSVSRGVKGEALFAGTRAAGVAAVKLPLEPRAVFSLVEAPGDQLASVYDPVLGLVTAHADGSVYLLQGDFFQNRTCLLRAKENRFSRAALGVEKDGVVAAFGDETGECVLIPRLVAGEGHLETVRDGSGDPIDAIALAARGPRFVTGDRAGVVHIFEGPGELKLVEEHKHPVGVSALAVSSDGNRILSGHVDGTINIHEGGPARVVARLGKRVTALAFAAPDESRVLAAVGGKLTLLDLRDGKPVW